MPAIDYEVTYILRPALEETDMDARVETISESIKGQGGEVVGAVNNFRFNESPVDLLNRFSQAGATQRSYSREWGDYVPRTATPALRVPDFNMSTVSKAS